MKPPKLLPVIPLILFCAACAGPGPRMFPVVPDRIQSTPEGMERCFDTNRDGKPDYAERLGPDGRITLLRYDTNGDGRFDEDISRLSASPDDRHLVIILDSVPYGLMQNLWDQGRFRLFYPPSCTISPFPVMTDLALAEFFGVSPCPGAESEFFEAGRLSDGYINYVQERNTAWMPRTNYHLINFAHGVAYFHPDEWFDHELHYIQKYFMKSSISPFVGYCVGTSALGAKLGRDGHDAALIRLDRMCERMMCRTRGKLQITLFSDHGHNLVPSKRVPLTESLERAGYRVGSSLRKPGDVVVPEFGVVTCAGIYTREAESVARDVLGFEGVEQSMFLNDKDEVVVLSRNGARARIAGENGKYRYTADSGDPLKLLPILKTLGDGFLDDRALLAATLEHEYPDAVHRCWRAFHGLIANQPDVLLTVSDGYHCGSKLMTAAFNMQAAHGNLGRPSSNGFVMTTVGHVPGITRMEDLAASLRKLGAAIP